MFKNTTIRMKLTLLSTLLLTICCIGLTLVLNLSAFRFFDSIQEAVPLVPINGGSVSMIPSVPTEPVQQARLGFSSESILFMLSFIVAGSALTYYVTGKALKPLETLNEEVKQMDLSKQEFNVTIPNTQDEIANLSQSFNTMAHSVSETFQAQRRFSMSAAHELRTPLTVLQTKLDVFKKTPHHTVEEYDALITVLGKQTTRLRSLIQDLLNMTQMDEIEKPITLSLKDLLSSVLDELGLNDRVQLIGKDRDVIANPDLLFRAFSNLIENATQYTTHEEAIEIEIFPTYILFKDNGIGIDKNQWKDIFEPFYRVDESRTRNQSGAGLGLSIVKSIVEKHNGSITLVDNHDFKTCFRVEL